MDTAIRKGPHLMPHHRLMLIGVLFCLFNYGTACAQAPSPGENPESQLSHTVKVERQGRRLVLQHVLLDPAGQVQNLRDITQEPPRFTVYLGDKKLATGQFEFG